MYYCGAEYGKDKFNVDDSKATYYDSYMEALRAVEYLNKEHGKTYIHKYHLVCSFS